MRFVSIASGSSGNCYAESVINGAIQVNVYVVG